MFNVGLTSARKLQQYYNAAPVREQSIFQTKGFTCMLVPFGTQAYSVDVTSDHIDDNERSSRWGWRG